MNYIVYVPTYEGKYYLTADNTFSELVAEARRFTRRQAKKVAKEWDVNSNTRSEELEVWHRVAKLPTTSLTAA